MKKILSLICAAALAMSMMAVTVSAAVEKPTVTTEYVDLSDLDVAGKQHFIGIKVTVEYPQTFAPYKTGEDDDFNTTYSGVLLSGFQIAFDVGEKYIYNESRSTLCTAVAGLSAVQNNGVMTLLFAPGATISNWYAGDSKIDLGTYAFRIAVTETADAKTVTAPAGQLTSAIKTYAGTNKNPSTVQYDNSTIAFVGAEIPAYPAVEEEEEPTAETVAAWDTGDGLLVIGKLLKADAAVYGVNIKDYELPAEATVKAGPDFPALAANPASEAGYYGINIIGIAAGDYEVAAYADGVYDAYTSVTVQ